MIAAMTESVDTASPTPPARRRRWVRPTAAVVAAVLAFALIPAGLLPIAEVVVGEGVDPVSVLLYQLLEEPQHVR